MRTWLGISADAWFILDTSASCEPPEIPEKVTQLTVVTTSSQLQPLTDEFRHTIAMDCFFFKGKFCERLGFKDLSTNCMSVHHLWWPEKRHA